MGSDFVEKEANVSLTCILAAFIVDEGRRSRKIPTWLCILFTREGGFASRRVGRTSLGYCSMAVVNTKADIECGDLLWQYRLI